jgi:hypothetical protein
MHTKYPKMPDPILLLQTRKQRWLAFYDRCQPRRPIVIIRYAPELPPKPWPNPEVKRQRIEWIWQNYQYHLQRMEWLDDDTIPCLDMITGTELFAEAFGCKVHRPANDMPFALPLIKSAAEAEKLAIPTLDAPPLALAFEMADELYQRAGPGALFRMVDLQSPMDVAALIWEKESFYPALIETPEAALILSEKVKTLQYAFLDEWFRRYGREFVAHYPEYYMPQGVTMSVDEIGALSSRMFVKFFLPELSELSQRYGGLGMHSCATNRHQWGNFKQIPGLRLLNINQPEAILREAYPYFADHVPQWHYGWGHDPLSLESWLGELPCEARLVVDLAASSKEQALELVERVRRFNPRG